MKIKTKDPCIATFFYLEKAFDSIDHYLLLYCLLKIGIRGRMIQLIGNLPKTREVSIRVNKIQRISFNPWIDVPHGGVLSPLLFIIFPKGFLEKYGTKSMYADDSTSLCSPSESILFSDTHEEFCRKWRLVNNYPKTEQMLFNVQNTACQYPTTDITKSLGVGWIGTSNIKPTLIRQRL